MVVGIDDSDHSFHALEWTLEHFFSPSPENSAFKLVVVHAKPSAATAVGGLTGPGTVPPPLTLIFDFQLKFDGFSMS